MLPVEETPGMEVMHPTRPYSSPWDIPTHEIDYRPYVSVIKVGVIIGATPDKSFADNLSYSAPKGNQVQRMQILTDMLKSACAAIERLCPPSRERSLALTDLQSARMFANASIILHETDAK